MDGLWFFRQIFGYKPAFHNVHVSDSGATLVKSLNTTGLKMANTERSFGHTGSNRLNHNVPQLDQL